MLWYIVAAIVIFYATPLICALIQFPLFNILPALYVCVAMVIGFMFAKRHGGDWLMCLMLTAVFIPCIKMFFNSTAWIYALLIGIMAFVGLIIGTVFKNRFLR